MFGKKTKNMLKYSFILVFLLLVSGCNSTHLETSKNADSTQETTATLDEVVRQDVTIESKRETNIYATLVTPKDLSEKTYPMVFFSHGFAGSRQGIPGENGEWVFETLSKRLAEKGILAIAIDFPGNNESEELFTEYTLNNMTDDIKTTLEYMSKNYRIDTNNIGLLGHSMGGRVTALSLSDEIKAAVLLAPAANTGISGLSDFMGGEDSVNQLYNAAKITGYSTFEFMGETFNLSLAFFEENRLADPLKKISEYQGNLFLGVALDDTLIPKSTTDKIINAASNVAELEVINLENASHIFTDTKDETDFTNQNYLLDKIEDFLVDSLTTH